MKQDLFLKFYTLEKKISSRPEVEINWDFAVP